MLVLPFPNCWICLACRITLPVRVSHPFQYRVLALRKYTCFVQRQLCFLKHFKPNLERFLSGLAWIFLLSKLSFSQPFNTLHILRQADSQKHLFRLTHTELASSKHFWEQERMAFS